jgi:DNA-binding Lrp family transcriptional regulator
MTAASPSTLDRAIVAATQAGLPLSARPYEEVAAKLGIPAGEVMDRLRTMQSQGRIRRIAAVPNHYALGLTFNAMTVWDVDDGEVERLGPEVGKLDFVTHCYRRPRIEGHWPYNLFAMVHGQSRAEADGKVQTIRRLLGSTVRAHDVLYSKRILKKTGFRLPA